MLLVFEEGVTAALAPALLSRGVCGGGSGLIVWLHIEIHCVIVILSYTRSLNRIPCHAHTCAVQELVTALIPSVGPEYGRSLVRVEGQGFRRMPQLSCMFGTTIVSGSWMSNSVVECLSITMPAGTIVEVRVANNGLDFSSSSAAFVFKGAPHLPRDLQGQPDTPPRTNWAQTTFY